MVDKDFQGLDLVMVFLESGKKGVEFILPAGHCPFRFWGKVMEENNVSRLESLQDAFRQMADLFIPLIKSSTAEGDGEQPFIEKDLLEAWVGDSGRRPEEQGLNPALL